LAQDLFIPPDEDHSMSQLKRIAIAIPVSPWRAGIGWLTGSRMRGPGMITCCAMQQAIIPRGRTVSFRAIGALPMEEREYFLLIERRPMESFANNFVVLLLILNI
jgi:hypothetical protein